MWAGETQTGKLNWLALSLWPVFGSQWMDVWGGFQSLKTGPMSVHEHPIPFCSAAPSC